MFKQEEFYHILNSRREYPNYVLSPPGNKVMVISPHPDDDVIGCGGTLSKHVDLGHRIKVIYVTEGSRGGSQSNLKEIREIEAINALSSIGVNNCAFLSHKDGEIHIDNDAIEQLIILLKDFNPDTIYTPHVRDNQPDHIMTNILLREALTKIELPSINIIGYEVWSPLEPTILVNISDYIEKK